MKITDSLFTVALALSFGVDFWAAQLGACSRACSGANELVPIGNTLCVGWQSQELRLVIIM